MIEQSLSDFIQRHYPGVSITRKQKIQSLWSDYGEICRLHLQGAPWPTVVLKHIVFPRQQNHPRGWSGEFAHQRKKHSYVVETHWYQHYAPAFKPYCAQAGLLAVESRDDEHFLLLEDLHNSGFTQTYQHIELPQVQLCLQWLAQLHAQGLGREPEGLWPVGCYWHLDTRPDEFAAMADGCLKEFAVQIDARLKQCQFKTLLHGDAKLANFCFSENAVAAVDFQYAGEGCGMKDVAYFLGSCLNEQQCQDHQDSLLEYYFQQLGKALQHRGAQVDFSALESEWRALYAYAWTDFYRFLQGWAPGHAKIHAYTQSLAEQVFTELASQ